MRKNFLLLMLLTLLPLAGWAQRNVGDVFPADAYVYEVLAVMDETDPGEVALIGIRDGWTAPADHPEKALIQDGALVIPNQMSADLFGETYTFNVVQLGVTAAQEAANPKLTAYGNPLQTRLNATGVAQGTFTGTAAATKIEFPAHIAEIPANCFNGWTNVNSITFAAGSELQTINNFAFATTQITKFDFSPCSQLAALPNQVFVEDGKINSYITEITLPEDSKLLKDIQGAFKHLPNLTTIKNLDKSSITQVIAEAFDGDAKLTKIELPGTVQTIAANAFKNCGVSDLTINVGSLITAGDGATQLYGTAPADLAKLTKLTLKGNLGGIITTNAFKAHGNLAALDLSALNFASKGQIAESAFEGCTKITSVTLGNINDEPGVAGEYTIDNDAFKGCTGLATVTIGNINSANAIGAAAFGNSLKTVTIGTVKAGGASILNGAFVFANVKGASLRVATGENEYLSSDDASTEIIETDAFKFDAIDGSLPGWVYNDNATVTFGEIRSKGGVFEDNAVSGNFIREITFAGDIAQGGLDAQIYDNTANAQSLQTIKFNGNLATGAIEANAFANLAAKKTIITFSGSLAKEAIMKGAFEGLFGDPDGELGSQIKLTGTPADATVNPFEQEAFQAGSTQATVRTIWLTVTNAELLGRFKSNTKGLKSGNAFDVFRVDFYVAPVPDDNSFLVYPNANDKTVAWARINFAVDQLSATLAGGTENLKIQRVQTIDGAKAKLTLYGTYTDEDDALNASTIYMVPLKVTNGFYHINMGDNEVIIAKLTKAGNAEFTLTDDVKSHKVAVATAGYDGGNESLWPGLHNSELYIAANIMTNQQLIDKTASDWYGDVDIYRGGASVVEDLYIMTDPSKNKGFRIDKTVIEKKTDGTGAYINKGWYYMLLKHYTGQAAAAPRVIWMDDATESDITGILEVKHNAAQENAAKSNAIYTLQGVRVSQTQKGQIYIQNGKKFIAK